MTAVFVKIHFFLIVPSAGPLCTVFFVNSSANEASSNKVESIFQQPIPWAVEKYTKKICLSKNLQNSTDEGKIKMSKM